jgi:hypothetical protein
MKWYYFLFPPVTLIFIALAMAKAAKRSDEVMYPRGWWI